MPRGHTPQLEALLRILCMKKIINPEELGGEGGGRGDQDGEYM